MNSTTEDFDDSWIDPLHKKELLITIKNIYNTAYYVHRYDFTALGYVQQEDTVDFSPGVPLKAIDGSIGGNQPIE